MANIATSMCSFEYSGDNYIRDFSINNSNQIKFQLDCAIGAFNDDIKAKYIFDPIPNFLVDIAKSDGKDIIEYMKCLNLDRDKIHKILIDSPSDFVICSKLGNVIYCFIKYLIMTSNIIMVSHNMFVHNKSNLFHQFKIIHSKEKEEYFKNKKTKYFVHGSITGNWYSIIRNGLKIPIGDNSKLFRNGSVYGDGIYVSDSPKFSIGYSKRYSINHDNDNYYVMGIYEIIEEKVKFKSNNIYIVDDEKSLILRYILYFHNSITIDGTLDKINSILTKLETFDKKSNNNLKLYKKRLEMEYKKWCDEPIYNQEYDIFPIYNENGDISSWKIIINIQQDNLLPFGYYLYQKNIKYVELEFIFGKKFPMSPPFIRLVYPRIIYNPSIEFIDNGGGICTSLFSNKQWLPAYSLNNMIIQAKNMLLSNSDLEIDLIEYNIPYTQLEALMSYNQILASHGIDGIDLLDI